MILAQSPPVPSLDAIGLPGPPLVFVALLLLTQFLHVVLMNFVLGGSLIAVGLNAAALRRPSPAGEMAHLFYRMVPVTLSMAITMGVAPLLFVQVLYGPYFYSANVLMGLGWFSFFVAVLVGFYSVYWLIFHGWHEQAGQHGQAGWHGQAQPYPAELARGDGTEHVGHSQVAPVPRLIVSVLVAACFLWVGWVMANNHELSLRPALWHTAGFGSSRWHTPAPTTLPRYLHDLMGATAVAGLWLAGIGWWRKRRSPPPVVQQDARNLEPGPHGTSEDVNSRLIHLGLRGALHATTTQMLIGAFFLIRLAPAVRDSLLGFNSVLGGIWTAGLALLPILLAVLLYASLRPEEFRWYVSACVTTAAVIATMLMGREHVRLAHLGLPESGAFTFGTWAVYPQKVSLMVFAGLLAAGLAVVALMVRWILQGAHPAGKGEGNTPRQPILAEHEPSGADAGHH